MTRAPWPTRATAGDTFAGGTGHRALPLNNLEWIKERTRAAAMWLATERGVTDGICGMADGWDLIWGDAVTRAGMRLWAAVPYPEQPRRFRRIGDRDEWRRLLALAGDRVWEGQPLEGLEGQARQRRANQQLWQRNLKIVEPVGWLVCCWNPAKTEHCGTFNAINSARARKLPPDRWIHLDPVEPRARMRIPEPAH